MNKNQYRLIFNRARNIMMVVAECVKSHSSGSSTKATSNLHQIVNQTAHQTASQPLTLRPLAFSVMLALGMVGLIPNMLTLNTAHADPAGVVADQAAAANQRPMVIQVANGIPLVNIQTPSSAGVSRNTYSQFDVNGNGVILNNSRTNVQTQLGGFVQGNPYLATGTARVILNEVNSQAPSYLNGYVELAGSRAQVIIANPAGISCQGCGFINTSVATLTTGTPIINSGDLIGYRVGGGIINFLGAGLDASQTDYTHILARAINVNAGIWAQNLNIVAGNNQVNVASNGDITSISSISPNTTQPDGSANPTPNFAIDVAALGGMYAGKIHLIGTEAGVGVRNAGYIGASVGEVTIDMNGNLINSHRIHANTHTNILANNITNTGGTITTGQHLNMQANSLTGDGKVLAGGDANITLTSDYTHSNTGELQADGNLTLTSTGNITNQAKLLAGNILTLNAANITNTATGEISGLATHINTTQGGIGRLGTGTLTNRGLIDGSNTFIHTNTLNNNGTGSIFGDHIAIATNTLNNVNETANGNTTAAVIAARSRMDIGSQSINNINDSLLFSAGDMAIGGALDANHLATVSAGSLATTTLINQGATIEALGNLNANVTDSQNLNAGLTTQTAFVSSTAYHQFTPRGQSVILEVADYPGAQIGNFNMSWRSAGPYTFREYYRYVYTGSTSETQVLTSAPAKLLSGSNMTLVGNITNSDSKIIAGSALDVTGATINNLNTQGQTTTSYNGTLFYYDYDGSGGGFDYDISASAYNPANSVTTFNLATTQTVQNTAPASVGAASGTTVATLNSNTLPTNSLFTPTTNPTAGYLIETNPRFANYRTWLSSDYMLSQLSYDPATQTKRLGDGFYEQRLIREQVNQLTGQRFLAGYADEETQYQALMQHGITAAHTFQLTPGIALSAAQVAQLTSDIVWLVEQSVTLPNGTVTQVLVPRVYAKLQAGDISNTGSLLAGNSVKLNLTGDTINSGTIGSRTLLALNTNNLHNLGGIISGHDVQLSASQDIHNIGGSITAQNSFTLNAGRDINVQSTTQSAQQAIGASTFTRTNLDRVAGLYVTGGQGLMVASAGNDMHLDAAQLINTAPTGAGNSSATNLTLLKAGNNLTLGTVQIAEQNNSIRNPKNYLKHGSTQDIGTQIQTQGDITLMAGHDLHIKAANITSSDGDLLGIAGKDLTVTSGESTSNMSAARYVKKSGSFSSKKTTTRDTFNDSNSIGSSLSANAINLVAGAQIAENGNVSTQKGIGDMLIKGSNVVATQDVNLNAGSGINIIAAQDTHDETHYKKVKQSGLSTSGASVTLGSSQLTNTNDSQQVTHVASTVGSIEGNVNITSGKTYNQTGSDILTPAGNIDITAQQVNITAATDTYNSQQTTKYKQSGITLALSAPVITAVQAAVASAERSKQVKDDKLKSLYELKTALNVVKAADAVQAIANSSNPAAASGVQLSLSIGTSKSSSTSTSHDSVAQGASLTAARGINITATGNTDANSQTNPNTGNITMVGVNGNAGRDINLDAANDINLLSATNESDQHSKNKNSSAAVGIAIGASQEGGAGISVFASASAGKGKTNGNAVSHTETTLKAGDTLNITSGHDTTLKGAIVSGNSVIADIGTNPLTGGNLRLESEQDTQNYKSKKTNTSGGISYTFGAGGFGGSISKGKEKINSNYNSVIEQTAIQAGNGGFNINVAGNTHLKGAVIDSSLAAQTQGNNQLTTATLTTENIENKGEYTASNSTMGINLNGNTNTGTDDPAGGSIGSSLKAGLGGMGVGDSGEAHGTTKAAIANADITIADDTTQQQKTGQTAAQTVATLNRDTQHANGSIQNPFNLEKVQEQLEFLQVAGETLIQPAMAQTAKWIGDQFPPDPNDPTKIDPVKILAHAALGAAVSQLLGTGWQTGAAAGALGDVLPIALAHAFEKDENGKIKDPEAFKAANAIISALLASGSGADLSQTINAAMITQNAVANNFLGHQQAAELAKLRAKAKSGEELKTEEKKQLIYLEATDQLSDGLLNKYRSGESLTETEQKNLNIYLGLYATQNGEAATIILLQNGAKPDYNYPYGGSYEDQVAYMKNLNDWKAYWLGRDVSANEQLYRDARAETGLYLNTVRNEAFLPTSMDNAQKVAVLDALINSPVLATGTYLGGTMLGADQQTISQTTILASQLSDIGASFVLPKTGLSPVLGETTVNPKALPLGTGKIFWVFENAGMSEQAKNYNDAATGARSDGLTTKGLAPALENVANNGKVNIVKFDGVDGNILIDRKLSVVTTDKSKDQAMRQSEALMQNDLVGRWEVSTQAQANRAVKMFEELGIKNIQIKVVKP